jgi:hypothetical protein
MINFDVLKAEFDKRQQERERNFNAATMMARVMLADFPADLLPSEMVVEPDCSIFVKWSERMIGNISNKSVSLSSLMRGYPDPKDPKYGVELLTEIRAAMAYKEPCETCTHCNQPLPARGDE